MPKTASILLISSCLGLFAPVISARGETFSGRAVFHIPSQSLAAALETYARISGREVLYDGRLAEGRRSSTVEGAYAPETALQILLAGTDVQATAEDNGFFVLSRSWARRPSDGQLNSSETHYYGAVQVALRSAFCAAHVLPDTNRIAARLWLDQSGAVLQARLLGSTGNSEWDERAIAAMHRVQLSEPPPGFAQPVTIVILPRSPGADDSCVVSRKSSVAGP